MEGDFVGAREGGIAVVFGTVRLLCAVSAEFSVGENLCGGSGRGVVCNLCGCRQLVNLAVEILKDFARFECARCEGGV